MNAPEKIYEIHVIKHDAHLERISATSVDDLKLRIERRGWRIAPCSVPREIERFEVRE